MIKSRILSLICVSCILFGLLLFSEIDVRAAANKVDGSSLTNMESSKGTTHAGDVRGKYLMDGECSITKAGRGRIYVYAATTANNDVDYLSTVLYVDQYNASTGIWEQITGWQVEDHNTYYVSTSKTLMVERGYYYRVHADHVGGMKSDYPYEEATSLTDGIWID